MVLTLWVLSTCCIHATIANTKNDYSGKGAFSTAGQHMPSAVLHISARLHFLIEELGFKQPAAIISSRLMDTELK